MTFKKISVVLVLIGLVSQSLTFAQALLPDPATGTPQLAPTNAPPSLNGMLFQHKLQFNQALPLNPSLNQLNPSSGFNLFQPLSSSSFGLGSTNDFGLDLKPSWWDELPPYSNQFTEQEINSCEPGIFKFDYDEQTRLEELNWLTCLPDNTPRIGLSESDKLKNDLRTCECIRNSKIVEVQQAMNQNKGKLLKTTEASVQTLKAKAEREVLVQNLNGLMFNMLTIVGEPNSHLSEETKKHNKAMVAAYSQTPYPKPDEATKFMGKDINQSIFRTEHPLPDGRCIGPSEFMRTKQVPSPQSAELLEELQKAPFDPDAWDYKKLERDYFVLMDLPMVEKKEKVNEIRILKNKLKFLNYNPLLKYAFSVQDPSGEEKEDSKKAYADKKAHLFEQMRTLASKDCQSMNGECRKKFNAYVAGFLLDPALERAIQLEKIIDHKARSQRKATRSLPTNMELNQDQIIETFKKNYSLGDPRDCKNDISVYKADDCLSIYAPYCALVDSYQSRIDSNNDAPSPVLVDDLDESFEDFIAGAEGKEYKNFNDLLCKTSARARGIFGGAMKNFFEFRRDFCKGTTPPAVCDLSKPGNYALLRERFFQDKFKLSEEQKNSLALMGISPDAIRGLTDGSTVQDVGDGEIKEIAKSFESTKPISLASEGSFDYDKSTSVSMSKFGGVDQPEFTATTGSTAAATGPKDSKESKDEGFNFQQPVTSAFNPFAGFSTGAASVSNAQPQPAVKEVPTKESLSELLQDTSERLAQVAAKPEPQRSEADKQAFSMLQTQLAEIQASYARISQGMALSEEQNAALQKQLAQLRERQTADGRRPASVSDEDFSAAVATRTNPDSLANASNGPVGTGNRNPSGFGSASFGTSGFGAGNVMSPIKKSQLVNVSDLNGNLVLTRAETVATGGKSGEEANGIAVPVSNKVYAEYLKNPEAFDFKKISGAIDPKQLEAVKGSSEITLLLVNGNQTVEVKVRRNERGGFVPVSKPTMRKNLYSQFTAIFEQATKR